MRPDIEQGLVGGNGDDFTIKRYLMKSLGGTRGSVPPFLYRIAPPPGESTRNRRRSPGDMSGGMAVPSENLRALRQNNSSTGPGMTDRAYLSTSMETLSRTLRCFAAGMGPAVYAVPVRSPESAVMAEGPAKTFTGSPDTGGASEGRRGSSRLTASD